MTMAEFSNSQILAAVVSEWARPAISQIAADKLGKMSWMQTLQSGISSLGIIDGAYDIAKDLQPIMMPAIDAIIEPMLQTQFAKIPDYAIPQMARNIVNNMEGAGTVSLLNGLVVLDTADFAELRKLLDANLPLPENSNTYKIKKPL